MHCWRRGPVQEPGVHGEEIGFVRRTAVAEVKVLYTYPGLLCGIFACPMGQDARQEWQTASLSLSAHDERHWNAGDGWK